MIILSVERTQGQVSDDSLQKHSNSTPNKAALNCNNNSCTVLRPSSVWGSGTNQNPYIVHLAAYLLVAHSFQPTEEQNVNLKDLERNDYI